MDEPRVADPTVFVMFGATGDLAKRKLIPALFSLHEEGRLPPLFQIVGFSRQVLSDDEFRRYVSDILTAGTSSMPDDRMLQEFLRTVRYVPGDFTSPEGYVKLGNALGMQDGAWRVCANKLFYLAVPPAYYENIFRLLSDSGLAVPCGPDGGWTRVIVEKPFGNDAETANRLDVMLARLFTEEQIYRIDHYLGKETVQNILAFRFSNDFLTAAWDHRSIERVDIRVLETVDAGSRGSFYDAVGALRDVGQNHLLQLLALIAMEEPRTFDAEGIRARRAEVLRKLRPIPARSVARRTVRAQYEGYRDTPGVAAGSETETYFRIRAELDASRWRGVPFYLESGKSLDQMRAEVAVTFRHRMPCLCPAGEDHVRNVLRYEIQPDERIAVSLWVKKPGFAMDLAEQDFVFDYHETYLADALGDPHINPYRKLLLDAMAGNQMLFVSTDEIKASWKFIDAILAKWKNGRPPLVFYPHGAAPESMLQSSA